MNLRARRHATLALSVVAVAAVLATGAGQAQAAATFSASTVNVGAGPIPVAVGDFNGDGHADLAVVNSSANSVSILLGDGAGGFTRVSPDVAVGSELFSVKVGLAVGDFNGDGHADLAVTNFASDTVSILLGDGTGHFTRVSPDVGVGTEPASVAVGDFNGDGHPDLAVANRLESSVSILLGDGTGGFTRVSPDVAVGSEPLSVAVGDFNGDGHPDLAVANHSANSVSVLLGDGTGHFTRVTPDLSVGGQPPSVAVGDFNGDGHADLAVANSSANSVSVLLGDGTGHFTRVSPDLAVFDAGPVSVAVGDFNGDGHADLATADGDTNSVSVLLGDGTGHFSDTGIPFGFVGYEPQSVAVGDFNGDGHADLAVTNFSSDTVSILRNQDITAAAPPICHVRAVIAGPPEQTLLAAIDLRSGIRSIQTTAADNATVRVAPFAPLGAFSPEVQVVGTRTDQTQPAQITLVVTDGAGLQTTCTADMQVATVTATVGVGKLPTGVAATNTRAYVANSQSNTVSVIDTTKSPPQVIATIPVGAYPNGVALSADGSQLYVTDYLASPGTLTIIQTPTNTVQFVVPVGSRPDGVAFFGPRPDGVEFFRSFVYVANLASGTVSQVDPTSGTVVATIALPPGGAGAAAPSGLVATPPSDIVQNGTLYVDDARNGVTLQVTLPKTVAGSVAAGVHPAYISAAGSAGYVASPGDNSIKVLNLSILPPTAVTSVTVGAAPYGVVADPAAGVVLATSSGAGTMTAIDPATNTVISFPVAVGKTPDTVAVSPDGATAFVTNESDGTLSVLHITPLLHTTPPA